jgi:heat shock protein HslJ
MGFFIFRTGRWICMESPLKRPRTSCRGIAGAAALVFLILAAGCTGQNPGPRLEGSDWTLVGYTPDTTTVPALAGTTVTLVFEANGRVSGSAGCNRFFAIWDASGEALTIGQAGSTMMYCERPGLMEQESAYLVLLANARTFSIDGDRLSIAGAAGTPILTFARTVPVSPRALAGSNWSLASMYSGTSVSSVITGSAITAAMGPDGSLTGSAGCNRYFGTYNQSGTEFSISSVGSTKMMCHDPGIMNQESAYLGVLPAVRTFTLEENTLILAGRDDVPLLAFTGRP